ncbi:receptor-transporting protein 3-like [Centruroides sculpturatus]|uniref:receptor-transporting protein 3-like n=1 Tax=Centruroides sculpturatus TaxID=218467 RepID=UPI000C6C9956|nr:receptor-transporting protein 3-like [Centruroides sculpturatus]
MKKYTLFNMVTNEIVHPALPYSMGYISTIPVQINESTVHYPTAVVTFQMWKQLFGMEQIWHMEFYQWFSQYPEVWHISCLRESDIPPRGWYKFVDSAKVRFCCESCGHGWTSMKGRVAFWFTFYNNMKQGFITFKLYGQICDKCNTGKYETAMWYPEEVNKVLRNLYFKVGQKLYGVKQPPINRNRRPGKPRTPHNSNLCQACKDGVCSEPR